MKRVVFIILVFLAIFMEFSFGKQKDEVFVYDSAGKRDPFISLVTPDGYILDFDSKDELSSLQLEGIIFDPSGSSFAVINGMVVEAGDNIGNIRILEIYIDKVIILKDNKKLELELRKEEKE